MEGPAGACFTDRGGTAMSSAAAQVARAHQAPLNRVKRRLGSALQLELAANVSHVSLHGLLSHSELPGHLLVCLPLRDVSQHGRFPLRQQLVAPRYLDP